MEAKLHPNLTKLSWLLGTWKGSGKGFYPTIKSFEYEEEIKFWHIGKPFLFYSQKTWNPQTSAPMHSEMGYLRVPSADKAELALTQPTGVISVEVCNIGEDGKELNFSSSAIERTPSAKHPWVKDYTRSIRLSENGEFHYKFSMSTENQPLQPHLEAQLKKVQENKM